MNGTVVYALLNKRITSSITGIGSVKLVGTSTLEFTNKYDNSKFTVKLPFDIATIEVVKTLPTPSITLVDKVYFLLADNCFYKCVLDTLTSTYKFQDITSSGMNIYEDYNSLPTVGLTKDTICCVKNDYTDVLSGTVYKAGFYFYDTTTSTWKCLNSTSSDYTTQITTASKVWSIQHNLNTEWWKLQINIVDNDGNVVYGDVDLDLTTNNLLVLNFEEKTQGKIYIKN